MRPVTSLLLAIFCLAPVLAQQGAAPSVTFKAEIDYVDVDAIVTDQQGNFISDLKIGDFGIFEDGKRQKIDMFSFVDLPIDRRQLQTGGSRQAPVDVKSNQQAGAGRLYVIVLDDLDTSFFRTTTVRLSARRFVER